MGFKADDIFDFIYHTIRFCTWQVDFVDNWKDIQVMVKGKIYICQCLGFDSLSCIYYQDCTVAGCKASGYFVIEVYMAGGVDQVEDVFFAVFGFVYDSYCLRFNGDSTFSFKFHVVQYL